LGFRGLLESVLPFWERWKIKFLEELRNWDDRVPLVSSLCLFVELTQRKIIDSLENQEES